MIDLKVEDFKPEFTGKMSFYLTAVDELKRSLGLGLKSDNRDIRHAEHGEQLDRHHLVR